MKNKFLNYAVNTVHINNPSYTETKLSEIRYGLEGMYLSVTKLFVIFLLAMLLNILNEMIFMLVIFNILRSTGFGLHATKSSICLLSSSLIFLGGPLVAKIIIINNLLKTILSITSVILIYKYAPADTKKRPLIKEKKRNIYKFITTVNCIILNILIIFIKNNIIVNLIILGIYAEVIIILPKTYKLFNMSYGNYKNYKTLCD